MSSSTPPCISSSQPLLTFEERRISVLLFKSSRSSAAFARARTSTMRWASDSSRARRFLRRRRRRPCALGVASNLILILSLKCILISLGSLSLSRVFNQNPPRPTILIYSVSSQLFLDRVFLTFRQSSLCREVVSSALAEVDAGLNASISSTWQSCSAINVVPGKKKYLSVL